MKSKWSMWEINLMASTMIQHLSYAWTTFRIEPPSKRYMTNILQSIDTVRKSSFPFAKMMAASIKQGKNLLRKEMKTKLSTLSDRMKGIQSMIVTRKLLELPQYKQSKRVSVYLSMKNEIDTEPIVQHILNTNRACYIPRYDGSTMSMVQLKSWQDYLDLPETKWKIKQPPVDEIREDALETGGLDVILTPGVAFTTQGSRCGHGKGYYDGYIQQCEDRGFKPVTVGLAFHEQILEDIPITPTDKKINFVLYPTTDEILDVENKT